MIFNAVKNFSQFLLIAAAFLHVACQQEFTDADQEKAQIETFVQKIEHSLDSSRTVVLDLHFDKATFAHRVVEVPELNRQLAAIRNVDYKPNYCQQLVQNTSLSAMFLSGINPKQFFAYNLVRTYQIEGRWHAIFRLYANEALNYHDFLLRVDSAKVWIEDLYITSVGQQLSEVVRAFYIAGIPIAQNDVLQKDQQWLVLAKQLMQRQQFEDALATFDSLSPTFQQKKSVRFFKLQVSANIPNENYIREIERYEKDFPNDVGTQLLQLDKNFMSGNYPAMLAGLNKLEKMYGQDPVVDFMRGNALNLGGHCDSAAYHYKIALAAKPKWADALNNWVDCLLKAKKYNQAIVLLKRHASAQQITPSYVRYHFRKFPAFLASEAYRQWAKREDVLH